MLACLGRIPACLRGLNAYLSCVYLPALPSADCLVYVLDWPDCLPN